MGKSRSAKPALKDFIEEIPEEKLQGFSDPNPAYTVYKTIDFRLDVQNVRKRSLQSLPLLISK